MIPEPRVRKQQHETTMVTIRLSRHGSKKNPFYHIVVQDKQKARDGRFIEQIGTYDPSRPITDTVLKRERLDHWVSVGAQLSERVSKVAAELDAAGGASS